MRFRFAAGLLLVVSQLAFAQGADVEIPYKKFVLKNGLTLIVHEDHKAPIVAVNVWYHVGSKNERLGKTGFAHLFEHLMFGGSEHHKSRYTNKDRGATDPTAPPKHHQHPSPITDHKNQQREPKFTRFSGCSCSSSTGPCRPFTSCPSRAPPAG